MYSISYRYNPNTSNPYSVYKQPNPNSHICYSVYKKRNYSFPYEFGFGRIIRIRYIPKGQKASLCCCLLWRVLAAFGVPVLILLSFPLLVSLSLGRVWVGAVLPPVVDTVTAAVFPSRVTANAEITLPESLVLAKATPCLSSSCSTSSSSTPSSSS